MQAAKGPLPLLIGITGHLDPEPSDIPAIERKLEEEFSRLAALSPHTSLLLLTGLAKGCDTIASRVAHRMGVGLVAVMPMAREDYLGDFSDHEAAEFERLLSVARKILVVGPTPENGQEIDRVACYQEAGLFIAGRSQILLALYNGVDLGKPAGTAEVIRLKREGSPPHLWRGGTRDLLPGTGEIRILRVRRQSHPEPAVEIAWSSLVPEASGIKENTGREHLGRTLSAVTLMEGFNWRVCREQNKDPRWGGYSLLEGLEVGHTGTMAGITYLDHAHSCADKMASFYRGKINRHIWYFFGLVFLATTLLELAENIDPWFTVFQVGGLVTLCTLGVFWWLWRKNAWMDKEIDYRAIAEGLRTTVYWRLAGVGDFATDHYPSDPRGELDWVRRSIAASEITVDPLEPPQRAFVTEKWLKGQSDWMAGKIHGNKKGMGFIKKIKLLKGLFIGLFVLVTILQLVKLRTGGFGVNIGLEIEQPSTPDHLTVIGLLIGALRLPAILALAVALYEVFGLEELLRQYQRAQMVFEAGRRAAANSSDEDFRKICLEVGRQALAENAEWAKIRRDRPLPEPSL